MISFFVPGIPQTKGSTRAFVVAGKPRITNDNAKARPWQDAVAWAAREAGCTKAEPGVPVAVLAEFRYERPMSHYGAKGLRPSAPVCMANGKDADKTLRVICDALTGIAYHDDRQANMPIPMKRYCEPNEVPGVMVYIAPGSMGILEAVKQAFIDYAQHGPAAEGE